MKFSSPTRRNRGRDDLCLLCFMRQKTQFLVSSRSGVFIQLSYQPDYGRRSNLATTGNLHNISLKKKKKPYNIRNEIFSVCLWTHEMRRSSWLVSYCNRLNDITSISNFKYLNYLNLKKKNTSFPTLVDADHDYTDLFNGIIYLDRLSQYVSRKQSEAELRMSSRVICKWLEGVDMDIQKPSGTEPGC